MKYILNEIKLQEVFHKAESELINGGRIKFNKSYKWRNEFIPSTAGIYAFFDSNNEILYVGQTGNIKDRLSDVNRTANHSFRKQLGYKKFGAPKTNYKFNDKIEELLDKYFDEELYVSTLSVNIGRLEIETFLVDKYQEKLYNSIKKRK